MAFATKLKVPLLSNCLKHLVYSNINIVRVLLTTQFGRNARLICTSQYCFNRDKLKSKSKSTKITMEEHDVDEKVDENFEPESDREYEILADKYFHPSTAHNCLVIQPYVKWGPKKAAGTPDLMLTEAVALVHSLPEWTVAQQLTVPLDSLDKKTLFGKGKLEELKQLIKKSNSTGKNITAVFISLSVLHYNQIKFLESCFNSLILDRYSVVIQILRLHATSKEARLQVAMAEIPYLWGQLKDCNTDNSSGSLLIETRRKILREREQKIKFLLTKLRSHREILRNKRRQRDYPVVAVVGYTNSGKTSLIKALTGSSSLQPRNQLFATLDVTAHAGFLPCRLEVLYMDTVGFMADIPTNLIECFVATLEDAMLADVIIHVQDISHEAHGLQKEHVIKTLKSLLNRNPNCEELLNNIITVANKIDLYTNSIDENMDMMIPVSARTLSGVDLLQQAIQDAILKATNRTEISFRVPMGGPEAAWLYKESAVMSSEADLKDNQYIILKVVISYVKITKFKQMFIK